MSIMVDKNEKKLLIEWLNELEAYRAIGTVEECRTAVERRIPVKPKNPEEDYGTFNCPSCNALIYTENSFYTHKFCLLCGQALKWEE